MSGASKQQSWVCLNSRVHVTLLSSVYMWFNEGFTSLFLHLHFVFLSCLSGMDIELVLSFP